MPRKLTLIRHAGLQNALDGCYVGRLDVSLSESGKQHAEHLTDRLPLAEIDALWCSPARRARETAKPLSERLKLDSLIVDDLNEVNFGRWEGLTFEQIRATDPNLVNDWAELKEGFCFPEGESHSDFQRRINTLAQAIAMCHHNHLALVTHGGVICHLLCELMGWPAKDYLKINIQRGGFATLDLYAEGAVLTGLYND
ncbi:histidine phosphatase family protein [Trichloromonas acetexigens]|uniref:Histidine phosphatase family protein n=1 Tax=Trichloromonas acetexigens TaxID=38815 RepID=A0A550J3Z5_9BACT|nr:histidine phosphatase family protein [Desulfuromonas acetexigens]TRO77832.1 histidine phosphatase family protein [Desulfuromonas acetexigens]